MRRALLLTVLVLVLGCQGAGPVVPTPPTPQVPTAAPTPTGLPPTATAVPEAARRPGRPNILLITVDSLRADRLGSYGGPARTPTFDRLAKEGVRFAQAYVQLPQTTPSHAALFTGQYPSSNGVRIAHHDALPQGKVTLAGVLAAAGYRTGGVYSWAGPADGLDQGFQTYRNVATPHADGRADLTTAAASAWLEAAAADRARPFFLWVHYRDPHYPYEPPPPYDTLYAAPCGGCADGSLATLNRLHEGWQPTPADLTRIMAAYDGEITFTDHEVGRLLGRLDALGLTASTLVVLTSDHGEAFGEHGEWFHGLGVYQPTIHVPLLARLPDVIPAGAVYGGVVQLIDIMPTVLDLLGLGPVPSAEGRSLMAALRGGAPTEGLAIVEVADWRYTAIVRGEWKLIRDNLTGQHALYHLPSDPGEQRDRFAFEPAAAARLSSVLDQWQATRAAGVLWRAP